MTSQTIYSENLQRLCLLCSPNNKYFKWYSGIVNKNRTTKFLPNSGKERHHVLPKSIGGLDDKNNLVVLSSREHFICHLLLVKMLIDIKSKKRMLFALNMMRSTPQRNRYFNARLYERHKTEFQQAQRERMTEYMSVPENRKKGPVSDETRKKLSEISKSQDRTNWNYEKVKLKGENRTEKQQMASKKHSEKLKGIPGKKAKEINIFGNTYKTIRLALKDLKITYDTLIKLLDHNPFETIHEYRKYVSDHKRQVSSDVMTKNNKLGITGRRGLEHDQICTL